MEYDRIRSISSRSLHKNQCNLSDNLIFANPEEVRYLVLHVPLSAAASRGDQILNARSFEKQGFSYVIEEETLTVDILLEAIRKVYADREDYRQAMEKSNQMDSVETILQLIESEAGK